MERILPDKHINLFTIGAYSPKLIEACGPPFANMQWNLNQNSNLDPRKSVQKCYLHNGGQFVPAPMYLQSPGIHYTNME